MRFANRHNYWRLNNRIAKVRQQAADLTTRLGFVIKQCGEDQQLRTLGLVLFEQLGKEYLDTLGSIVAAEADSPTKQRQIRGGHPVVRVQLEESLTCE
jgi:hypothetical protein